MNERVEWALDQLTSEHVDDVVEAMDLLRSMPDDAHEPVRSALAEHRGSQPNLAQLLGEWGRPESVPVLREAMERGVHSLRFAAAMALAEHADPTAAEALDELSRNRNPEIADMATLALGERRLSGE